ALDPLPAPRGDLRFMAPRHELAIPAAALVDDQARELARIWAAGGQQHIALATGLWDDPASWGRPSNPPTARAILALQSVQNARDAMKIQGGMAPQLVLGPKAEELERSAMRYKGAGWFVLVLASVATAMTIFVASLSFRCPTNEEPVCSPHDKAKAM